LWLSNHPMIDKVWHPSLPSHPSYHRAIKDLNYMPPVMSFTVKKDGLAEEMMKRFQIFTPATSVGGVESLAERRHEYDVTISPRLIRLSIGLESSKDLTWDLEQSMSRM